MVNGHSRDRCIRCLKLNPLGVGPEVRFWDHVQKAPGDGCWLWTGDKINSGYGRFTVEKVGRKYLKVLAHRYAWATVFREIPDTLELDHLCKVTLCVRPSHLEPVGHRENLRRGLNGQRWGKCGAGHPYDGPNMRVYSTGPRPKVRCLICKPYKLQSKERSPK